MEPFKSNDIPYIRITDFMEAMGKQPISKNGDIFLYNAPYNIGSIFRAYGIETKEQPTCAVDTVNNTWKDTRWSAYAGGNLRALANEMFDFHKDSDAAEKFIIEVMTEYNRDHPVYLLPRPSVKMYNNGNCMVMDIRPQVLKLAAFVPGLGYEAITRHGDCISFKPPKFHPEYPEITVDVAKNKWYDAVTGKGGDIYNLAARLSGEEDPSEHLWFIAEVMGGRMVNEMREPWGKKIVPQKSVINQEPLRPKPKRGMRL